MTIPTEISKSDGELMRSILRRYPTGVAVITALDGGRPIGMAVGSFTSVSLDPPMIGFFVDRSSTTWPQILEFGAFAVNVLGEHQADLSQQFSVRGVDRFRGVPWDYGHNGGPVIDGAVMVVESDIVDVIEAGDHLFVMGSVVRIHAGEDVGPLLFYGGGYARIASGEHSG
jgi:3-hydroxy-9,10-secoandrosta-1,3,5(10)-triene-9,17-dione monooxygenase reductase component